MLSDEYIAGFFDGEGHVEISATLQVRVGMSQKRKEVLELIQHKYGGNLHQINQSCGVWNLIICNKKMVVGFLTAIFPYSVVKKEEIEIALKSVSRIREDNLGCIPMKLTERLEREALRAELQSLRPKKTFQNLQAANYRYRQSIKEQADYKCNTCGKDMREVPIRNQVIAQDKLWCLSCKAKSQQPNEHKPVSKEEIERVLSEVNFLDEACDKLNLGRSALYKKRKKYGLSLRISLRGRKRNTYIT